MKTKHSSSNRRGFLKKAGLAGLGSALFHVPGLFAEVLTVTPEQTEGPYYPTALPLDTDNDLLVINDSITPAVGVITYLSGRILNPSGLPVKNAMMEIWHADNTGAYVHPSSMGYANRDRNFQGFGRFMTGRDGEYFFRTIRPGLYTGRTRHIHFKVKVAGMPTLTSQLYFLGEPQNSGDGVLNGIRDTAQRNSTIVPFVSVEGTTVGALAARFDVVLSNTAALTPSLTMTNLTDPTRHSFRPGDNWRADVRGASPGSRVYLHLWKDNGDLGVSGPYGDVTNSSGEWTLSGSYGSSETGLWQARAVIGAATSLEATAPVTIRVANP
jgi:protocatechuate 3,4-dioxygenase, beta subunit